jgi:hypothetical protein
MPTIAPLHPWEWPSSPWERVHIDFAGPFLDRMFFVLVDAHSKWPDIVEMKTMTSTKTIEVLRSIFSRNGIPAQIVSDNGSQFSSEEFATFMKCNGIKHFKSAPYHPATNGLAERFIQTFKNSMRAMKDENRDINQKIANFLLTYRNTPHSTTNETPAKLLLGRNLRTRLSEINENNIEEPEIVLPSINIPSTTVTDITVNDSAKNSNTETSEINNPIERLTQKEFVSHQED